MKLYINTSERKKIVIKIDELSFESMVLPEKSQMVVPFIETCLAERKKKFSDISEITVMTGPGSFTGLRVGVSVSQALAWSLDIPLNGDEFNQRKFVEIHY